MYKYSLTKNWLKNIFMLLLKYALIEDCSRFFSWRSSILFVIIDNISWLSSSKTRHRFILSSIVIISLKPMLSCSNWSFSSLPQSSLEISLAWSLAMSGFWIALMMFSNDGFGNDWSLAQMLEHFCWNWNILLQIYLQ